MSDNQTEHMSDHLSEQTSIFGLRLWIVLGVCVGAAFVLVLFVISLWLASKRSKNKTLQKPTIPIVSKEIQEIRVDHVRTQVQAYPYPEPDPIPRIERQALLTPTEDESPAGYQKVHIEIGKDHRITYPIGSSSSHGSGEARAVDQVAMVGPEVSHLGWGHWYTLRELEVATNGFVDENVIGEGGYGIVYHGVLEDKTQVAVKNLLNNRMLVYEYVNNGNLEQWLHGDVGPSSPLTWEIRMNIILGTAKGLTYLHEGLEPKVIHRDIKSSNILLDKQWNAKVSDFGLAKLIGSEMSYITTRVMGTFGYVAPEYASTGMLNERSDVYSFGILIMEIISGRNPVDYGRPPEEVNLVEWLKKMVANRNPEGVLDPKLTQKPTSRALKRALLVALRCVDPNAQKRPKLGHIVHMLEAEESPFKDDRKSRRVAECSDGDNVKVGLKEKQVTESGDSIGYESGMHADNTRWRHQEERL
ncbi:hypothetical protein PRUPE_7G131700 [Prunus persica]|uniref:non-specific serine/threonine protein kinase n=1 Tax=Prunus persica TaxID=3760 RepID=A0A251NAW4_PRUPE|nr:hypothetical protein PRUPE_7G131700 [Prunus persica]